MSFIGDVKQGTIYAPGYFLAHEECTRETRQMPASGSLVTTTTEGAKYVKMGSVFPSNDANAVGIVYEDVDVSTGTMPGSVVTSGEVIESRLPASVESSAKAVLTGIKFVSEPSVVRPEYPATLGSLTVQSAAGTAVGDTKITVSGYELGSGEGYKYKVATGTAPAVSAGEVLDSTWTAWNGTADITAATGKKITVVVVSAAGEAKAAGNATVTAK